MNPYIAFALLLAFAYLVGAIPFGYWIGRLRGVDLFHEGSGNIGATNAARVLGRKWGLMVFGLDFLKGAVPVAAIVPLFRLMEAEKESAALTPDVLRVGAAAASFLGHVFSVYLRFRGGKGVATGAGTIFVLAPGPAFLALIFWLVVFLASRTVSMASFAAVCVLVSARILGHRFPFDLNELPITLFLLLGCALVLVKHRSNAVRLWHGREEPILPDSESRRTALRAVHLLALGFWFGGAGFFNFLAAPAIFDSFKQVVNNNPSDRTAQIDILPPNASREALASALAGAAVGPIFPLYFGMQAVCAGLALVTALAWRPIGSLHRRRVLVIGLAALVVVIAWPISLHVSDLRVQRFDPNDSIAQAARQSFGPWHLVSLLLSFVNVCLAGLVLAMASYMPGTTAKNSTREGE